MGRESSPGDKRIPKPTIPGSQGQAPTTPTHSVLNKKISMSNYDHVMHDKFVCVCIDCKLYKLLMRN